MSRKGYRGLAMEGAIARWYAKNRGTAPQMRRWTRDAARLTAALPEGARVLEVAPGPGFFATEMARSRLVRVTGLDISRTFVELATKNARLAGVDVAFHHGDASRMPFADASFDTVVCLAAFKNSPGRCAERDASRPSARGRRRRARPPQGRDARRHPRGGGPVWISRR